MKLSILYLDDERLCLAVFEESFGSEFDVRTAATAEEARLLLAQRPADVVIADQSMPDISGTQFLAQVARDSPRCHRMLLTGCVMLGEVVPEVGSGLVHTFLAKPWSALGIRDALARAVSCLR